MVATYTASKMVAGIQPKYLPSAGGVNALSQISQTTSLATSDIINMVQLPAQAADDPGFGPTIIGMLLDVDRLDTGSSLLLSVGDSGSATRYYSSVTIGQPTGGGYAVPTQSAVLGYQPDVTSFTSYTTPSLLNYTIFLTATHSAATWANGKIRLLTEYTYDP